MTAAEAQSRQQARQWSLAFAISALANAAVLLLVAAWISFKVLIAAIQFVVLSALGFDPASFAAAPPPPKPPAETVAMIVPEMVAREDTPPPPKAPEAAPFARTSSDQEAERPENPTFIGERNTRATSDAPADAQAPMLPSQKGRAPHHEDEIETTVSKYQDGDLASDRIAAPREAPAPASEPSPQRMGEGDSTPPQPPVPPADPAMASQAATSPQPADPAVAENPAAPAAPAPEPVVKEPPPPGTSPPSKPEPPKDQLAQGPNQVERQVKEETPPEPPKPPAPDRQSAGAQTPREAPPVKPQSKPAAAPQDAPGFRGNQQKTRLSGSITRQGRSALDVEDSLLGRYHASLSRAVEKEWQLNCVRNRDYITPGQIIVRFVLEPSGKVRSLTFVEEFGVGNIQKGFTSESIRTAAIPPFPDELKKQLDGDPLEVTYSFTF